MIEKWMNMMNGHFDEVGLYLTWFSSSCLTDWKWSAFRTNKAALDLLFNSNVSVRSGCTINETISKQNVCVCPGHGVIVLRSTKERKKKFNLVTVCKILSVNVIFSRYTYNKIHVHVCLYLKNIHFWSLLCSHAFHSPPATCSSVQNKRPNNESSILQTNKRQLWLATQSLPSRTVCYSFLRQNYVPSSMWTVSSSHR